MKQLDELKQKREAQAMQPVEPEPEAEGSVSIGTEIAAILSRIEASLPEAAPQVRTSHAAAKAKAVSEMQAVLANPEFMADPSAAYEIAIRQLNNRRRTMQLQGMRPGSSLELG
jgi:hypothetical protein